MKLSKEDNEKLEQLGCLLVRAIKNKDSDLSKSVRNEIILIQNKYVNNNGFTVLREKDFLQSDYLPTSLKQKLIRLGLRKEPSMFEKMGNWVKKKYRRYQLYRKFKNI